MTHELITNPNPVMETSTCKNCGDPITRRRVGDWLHEPRFEGGSGSTGCPTNTSAQPPNSAPAEWVAP